MFLFLQHVFNVSWRVIGLPGDNCAALALSPISGIIHTTFTMQIYPERGLGHFQRPHWSSTEKWGTVLWREDNLVNYYLGSGPGKALLELPLDSVSNELAEMRWDSVTLIVWMGKLCTMWKWHKINLLALKIPEEGRSWAAKLKGPWNVVQGSPCWNSVKSTVPATDSFL